MEYENTMANLIASAKISYDGAISAVSSSTCATIDYVEAKIQEATKKPDVPMDTKSILSHDGKNIKVTYCKDGFKQSTKSLLPDIVDVIVYNESAVIVKFADNTQEKAVVHHDDHFSIEQGISICLTKKLMGGSSVYNKVIEHALDIVEKKRKEQEKKDKDDAARKERDLRNAQKKAKRIAKKKEAYIKTQAEIMARAMIEAEKMRGNA